MLARLRERPSCTKPSPRLPTGSFDKEPDSTFCCWAAADRLPAPLNNVETFCRRVLECRVMTVPGEIFDVNPGGELKKEFSFKQWVRFSFGPPLDNMKMGLDRLEEILR